MLALAGIGFGMFGDWATKLARRLSVFAEGGAAGYSRQKATMIWFELGPIKWTGKSFDYAAI